MRLILAALSAATLLASPALSADAPATSAAAPTTAAAPGMPAADPGTKVVCRSTSEIGSLVKRKKTCLTKDQWKYVSEQNENFARKMVADGTGRIQSN